MNAKDYLKSIGKECFIKFFEDFKNIKISRKVIKKQLEKEGYSKASCSTRASAGKQIFKKKLEFESLGIIIKSKNLDSSIIDKAKKCLAKYEEINFNYPDELTEETLTEGLKKRVMVNAYERSTKARTMCLEKNGYICIVCKFNFEQMYGELGKNFIHVHHVMPISEIGKKYKIDPINDLKPVCPNCHAMLHRKIPAYSIEELKNLIKENSF